MPPLGIAIVLFCFGIVVYGCGHSKLKDDRELYFSMVLPVSVSISLTSLGGIVRSESVTICGIVIVFGTILHLIIGGFVDEQIPRRIAQHYLTKNGIAWIDPDCLCKRSATETLGSSCPVHGRDPVLCP